MLDINFLSRDRKPDPDLCPHTVTETTTNFGLRRSICRRCGEVTMRDLEPAVRQVNLRRPE